MVSETPTPNRCAFDALVKEAEFLRTEALNCIKHVRSLAMQSTYIAGFALPVIAGLLNGGVAGGNLSTFASFKASIGKNAIALQFLCLGVCLTNLALLHIYTGSFLQIFNFARYFREHLIPSFNLFSDRPDLKLFYWEDWLKAHRATKPAAMGDADLKAEPVLIAVYVLLYGAAFVWIAIQQKILPRISIAIVTVVVGLTFYCIVRILNILDAAATDEGAKHPSFSERWGSRAKLFGSGSFSVKQLKTKRAYDSHVEPSDIDS